MFWVRCGLLLFVITTLRFINYAGCISKREADYTLDDSFWNEETPAGEVERLLRQYQQNEELVKNIGSNYYQIIYPIQLRHHEKMGISTREAEVPRVSRFPQKTSPYKNTYSNLRSRVKMGKHFHRTSLLIKAFNHKFRLDLELNTQLLAPNLAQKDFLSKGAEHDSKQEIEHCYYHGSVKDYPGASAAFHTCNGVSGVIHLGNETFVIHPFYGGDMSKHPHVIFNARTKTGKGCANSGVFHDRTKIRRQKQIFASDAMYSDRHKRDVEEVVKFIETAIFIDKAMFENRNGTTRTDVVHDIIQVANIADLYFRTLNTRVSIVYIETWQGGNRFTIDKKLGLNQALRDFNDYKQRNVNHVHDTAQLLTGESFPEGDLTGEGYSGIANPDSVCTQNSVGISVDINTYEPHLLAGTMAHMIGHNIGMSHDDGRDCPCSDWHGCIMSKSIVGLENVQPYKFSNCSRDDYTKALKEAKNSCLLNKPNEIDVRRNCGNGIIDDGEDCDCGRIADCAETDPCCDAITCKLKKEAKCATGPCCDNCRLKAEGSVCREATNECDLPEVCTGQTGHCPQDVYKKNGYPCAGDTASCFNGLCPAINLQCEKIWGTGGIAGDKQCFEQFNSKGSITGHCGTDSSGHFIQCNRQNVRCGLLQCQDGHTQPVNGNNAQYSRTLLSIKGAEFECKTTMDAPENKDDGSTGGDKFGLVHDGSPCGDNQICINQTCTNLFPHLDNSKCPSNRANTECSGNGVCNNLNACHCNRRWTGPDCSIEKDDEPDEEVVSSTEPTHSPASKNKMEKKETPYANYHGSNTVYLVITLMSVVGGVFVVFAMMALCYRSVVVHKNFSLCLRKKNTIQKFDIPYQKKPVQKSYHDPSGAQNPENLAALDSVNKILKFGRMPHYREHKPQIKRLNLEEDDGIGAEDVVSFIDLPPNSLAKLPEKGILKKHGGYGISGGGNLSDVEQTLSSLDGYHADILEALRNAHGRLSNPSTGAENFLDDEVLRKSLVERAYNTDYNRSRSGSRSNVQNLVDDEDLPPIRIRTLEDIIRQLEHHSTRHMSPVDSEDIRNSENENERNYRMDSSICSESSQGSRRCSRTRDDDPRFVYRYRQPTSRSPFEHHHHHSKHEDEGIYETADPDRISNHRGETPDSESSTTSSPVDE